MPSTATSRIDGLATSVAVKAPCRVSSSSNITLSGLQTIDSVSVVEGDRVLVMGQTDTTENGIYVVSSTLWERAKDFDGSRDTVEGTFASVVHGVTNGNTVWRVNTPTPIIGDTPILFERAIFNDSTTISFLQGGTGAVTRSLQDKLREPVSIEDFGAVGDGVTDDTVAIQAALDSGHRSILIPKPPVSYLASSVLMPNVMQFVLYGTGPGSILKQKAGASGALIRWATGSIAYNEHTLRDFAITGTLGTEHCIDTSGAGGPTIDSIYILDVPSGKAGIYVNGTAGTYVHDSRLDNIQIYSNTAGHSGIRLGPLTADSEISRFIMNGNLVTNYGLYADSGALTCSVLHSHPYNCSINVVKLAGTNNDFSFTESTFDRATNDVVSIVSSNRVRFTSVYLESIQAGFSGVDISGTSNGVTLINGAYNGVFGAAACVKSGVSTSAVGVFGGSVDTLGNFVIPFDLRGTLSSAKFLAGWNPYGMDYFLGGCQTSAQAQSTTQYLGVNSSNASESAVEYVIPYDSKCHDVSISVSATPVAGQTFTFRVRKNGVDVGTALVLNNGDFGGTITDGGNFSAGNRFTMSSIFSATSGNSIVRFSAKFSA